MALAIYGVNNGPAQNFTQQPPTNLLICAFQFKLAVAITCNQTHSRHNRTHLALAIYKPAQTASAEYCLSDWLGFVLLVQN